MLALLTSLLLASQAFATADHTAARALDHFMEAEQAYDFGDCFNAINLFNRAASRIRLSEEQKVTALFKTGYCYYNLGNDKAAQLAFYHYLRKVPDNDEARLRFSQSLYRDQKFVDSRKQAELIKDPAFLEEAWLQSVLASVSLGENKRVIDFISTHEVSKELQPAFLYWLGVAQYNHNSLQDSRRSFQKSIEVSPADHWVRTNSPPWIEQINAELKTVRGSLTLGYIIDSNVAQQSLLTVDSAEKPLTITPNKNSYINDAAYWVSARLTTQLYRDRAFTLTNTLSASSPFYQKNRAYNNQNLSAAMDGQIRLSKRMYVGANAQFLDSRYNYKYSQNYLIFDPYMNWLPNDQLYIHADLAYTYYVSTSVGRVLNPRVFARLVLADWVALLGGAGYSRSRGQTAYYTSYYGVPYVTSGSQFSRYSNKSLTLGATFTLPPSWSFTFTATHTWTDYESENEGQTTSAISYPNRGDKTWSLSGELSTALYKDLLYLGASSTYTANRSNGYQGSIYGNVRSDYNFNRLYTLISTTLVF